MARHRTYPDDPQLPLSFDMIESNDFTETLETRGFCEEKCKLYDSDRILFNAIFETAKAQNCNHANESEARWLIQIGRRDIVSISGLPRRTIQRSLKRLIEASYLDVHCAAKNGTEATVYLVLVRERIPEVAADDQP